MPETLTLDIEAARDLWKRLAPPNYSRLIDAEPIALLPEKKKRCETDRQRKEENRSFCALLFLSYFWNDQTGRYVTAGNLPLTFRGIKQAANTFAVKVQNQLNAIGSRYVDGSIGLREFTAAMTQKVTAAHTAAYAVGSGGLATLTGDVLAEADTAVNYHLEKLKAFVADVRRGGIEKEMVIYRAGLYGASLAPTTESAKSNTFAKYVAAGRKVEERNVLGDAEHCHATGNIPGCSEESAKGWRAYGELSRPGLRRCLMQCKCSMEYRLLPR